MQEIINEADVWFIDNDILPSSVKYNLYTEQRLLHHYEYGVAVVGVGQNRSGKRIGFAIEIVQGRGVVRGGILEPDGVATWDKKGVMQAIKQDKPLVDVMQEMAREHRHTLDYYEHVADEQGISLMEAMQKYPLPQYQSAPRSTPQESLSPIKPQATPSVADDEECEGDDNESKNHQENMVIYTLLWLAIVAGFIAQFFIEPRHQLSTTMFGVIWLVGFIVSVYAVFVTKQRFRDYNLLFIFMAPFAMIFWLSVLVGLQEPDKPTANNQVNNTTLNQAIDDIQSKGVANMHQTQTHQDIVSKTHQYLGSNPSDEKLQAYLQKMVDDTNSNLPIMVEQNVRADSMYLLGKIVMHYFTITDIPSVIGTNFDKNTINELKTELMNSANICKNNGHILKYGVSLSFSYSAVNKDKLFDIIITPQDCGY